MWGAAECSPVFGWWRDFLNHIAGRLLKRLQVETLPSPSPSHELNHHLPNNTGTHPMSDIPTSPIAADSDGSRQRQQLENLAKRVENALEPPITEIQVALQKHICVKAPPANTSSPSVQDKCTVELAVYTFRVIGACENHFRKDTAELDRCFLNTWPEIWRWLQFLDDHCCQRDRYGCKVSTLLSTFLALFSLSCSDALRHDVTSTPGVIAMVAGYWKDQGCYPDIERVFAAVDSDFSSPFTIVLNALLQPLDKVVRTLDRTPDYLLELITTMGSAEAVATHTIAHLNAVLAMKPHNFQAISAHISLINNLASGAAPKVVVALLNQGTITLMVKTLVWLANQPARRPGNEHLILKCVALCFFTLQNAMLAINGTSWVSQALDSGILPAILKSAPRLTRASERDSSHCSSLLSDILCQYLVYKSVLRSAAKALRRVERLNLDGGSGGPIWEAWAIFKKLVLERIALKEKSGQAKTKQQTCARLDCKASINHDELLRCSGCSEPFYCDKACQRMDWPLHKPTCQEVQQLLREGIDVPMSSTDAGFIAEIVKNDIVKDGKCLEKLLAALDASPVQCTLSDFIFSLDYTKVPVNRKVTTLAELNGKGEFWNPGWDSAIEKASQGNGKHVMVKVQFQRGGRPAFIACLIDAPIEW